jgi:hypothetical protein
MGRSPDLLNHLFGCDNMKGRKTKTATWSLAVCAVAALMIVSSRLLSAPWSLPMVPIYFACYTNSGAGAEALFILTNPPNASIELLSVRSSSQADGVSTQEEGRFNWGRREPWGLVYAIGVNKTNEALEVVWKLQLRNRGPKRVFEQARELFGHITGREHEYFTGTIFCVTNETKPNNIEL